MRDLSEIRELLDELDHQPADVFGINDKAVGRDKAILPGYAWTYLRMASDTDYSNWTDGTEFHGRCERNPEPNGASIER